MRAPDVALALELNGEAAELLALAHDDGGADRRRARRLVAEDVLAGVDGDRGAVELAGEDLAVDGDAHVVELGAVGGLRLDDDGRRLLVDARWTSACALGRGHLRAGASRAHFDGALPCLAQLAGELEALRLFVGVEANGRRLGAGGRGDERRDEGGERDAERVHRKHSRRGCLVPFASMVKRVVATGEEAAR